MKREPTLGEWIDAHPRRGAVVTLVLIAVSFCIYGFMAYCLGMIVSAILDTL